MILRLSFEPAIVHIQSFHERIVNEGNQQLMEDPPAREQVFIGAVVSIRAHCHNVPKLNGPAESGLGAETILRAVLQSSSAMTI